MKKQIVKTLFLLIIFLFTACGNRPPPTRIATPVRSLTGTAMQGAASTAVSTVTVSRPVFAYLPETPSPRATSIVRITPDPTQLVMWLEYQSALGKEFIPIISSQEQVLCEWEILGQAEQEVYVWALCQETGPIPSSMSAPAVIHLGPGGVVIRVDVPGSGSDYGPDIRRLFPPYVREIIFKSMDVRDMQAHILLREKNPVPPLIVLEATPSP